MAPHICPDLGQSMQKWGFGRGGLWIRCKPWWRQNNFFVNLFFIIKRAFRFDLLFVFILSIRRILYTFAESTCQRVTWGQSAEFDGKCISLELPAALIEALQKDQNFQLFFCTYGMFQLQDLVCFSCLYYQNVGSLHICPINLSTCNMRLICKIGRQMSFAWIERTYLP